MAKTRENPYIAANLSGIHIYQEPKRTVYYDFITKTGYVLRDKNVKHYRYLSVRPTLGLLLAACISIFTKTNLWIAAAAGLALYLLLELLFRFKFLKGLVSIENYQPSISNNMFISIAKENSKGRFIALFVIVALLILSFYANVQAGNYEGGNIIIGYIGCGIGIILAIVFGIAFYFKIKNKL